MTKASLLVVCTSLLTLDGCALAVQHLTKGRRVDKAQAERFASHVTEPTDRASQLTQAGLPEEIEDLEKAFDAWSTARSNITSFRTETEFGGTNVGDCMTGERKSGDLCKKSKAALKAAETKLAKILTASLETVPTVKGAFPAYALTELQDDGALAKALDPASSIATLSDYRGSYWAKRAKQAGGASKLVRNEGDGMCFFADAPHGKDARGEFLFDSSTDELHVRCITPDQLRSYKRSTNDTIMVQLFGPSGHATVKEFPVAELPPNESIDLDIPVSLIAKAVKQHAATWKFVTIRVQYIVANKVGVREVNDGDRIRFEDDIEYRAVANGFAMFKAGKVTTDDDDDEANQQDDEDTDTAASDEESPKPKTARNTRKKSRRSR